jgi:hypothetical protein
MNLEEKRCTNCEEQRSTIKHLMLIHKEKEQTWQQRCEDLEKQSDCKNEECKSLKTQLNHNHEKTNLLKDLVSN